jgi:large subunit ribosomal protein L29
MANIVELREMSDNELEEMLENDREEIFNLRFQLASARLEDVSRIRYVRREIAQLETVLRMRELAVDTALDQAQVQEVVEGKEWDAEAHFVYEDSAWRVDFTDENEDELITISVDLNSKRTKSRRARRDLRKQNAQYRKV